MIVNVVIILRGAILLLISFKECHLGKNVLVSAYRTRSPRPNKRHKTL